MHRSLWVQVAHSSFIKGSHMTKNTATVPDNAENTCQEITLWTSLLQRRLQWNQINSNRGYHLPCLSQCFQGSLTEGKAPLLTSSDKLIFTVKILLTLNKVVNCTEPFPLSQYSLEFPLAVASPKEYKGKRRHCRTCKRSIPLPEWKRRRGKKTFFITSTQKRIRVSTDSNWSSSQPVNPVS